MKYSVFVISALSASALAAPAPTLWFGKSCAYKKPQGHYPDNYHGCLAYNAAEIKYKLKCPWYDHKLKHCKLDWKDKDDKVSH